MGKVEKTDKQTDLIKIPNKERDYFFDNLKAILIFCVVLGHFLGSVMGYKEAVYRIILYPIRLIHMPLFLFVAGYFTKYDEKNTEKAIKNYLIPYILFSIILYLYNNLVLGESYSFKLLKPQYAMWFLLTMFIYKIIYNGIYKIKGLFVISIILSIIVGFDTSFTHTASMSRTVAFFPFL